MTWQPKWHERNIERLMQLAPHTRAAAFLWYQFCLDRQIDVYVTETLRTLARQKELLAQGASKTLKSYHIVGQAFDFVPMVNGKPDYSLYKKEPFLSAVNYAKQLGFEWGGDWKGFVDSPHMQWNHKGYGTDNGNVPYKLPVLSTPAIVNLVPNSEYVGKKLTVKEDGLWYYDTPRWDVCAGTSNAGDKFIIVEELCVNGGRMLKCHDGKYRTADAEYVDVNPKPEDWPYRVVIDEITHAQARALVIELGAQGFKNAEGQWKTPRDGGPSDNDPYRVVVDGVTLAQARLLVIDLGAKGYTDVFGEAK